MTPRPPARRGGLDRRTVLRGLLGGAAIGIGLPALETFLHPNGDAWADGGAIPTRLGLFYWGNGNVASSWVPSRTGQGSAWSLSPTLSPLEPHKSRLTVVSGLTLRLPNTSPHHPGACGILTGRKLVDPLLGFSYPSATFDQVAADTLGAATTFRSLEFGAVAEGGLSFRSAVSRNPAEDSPHALFARVFGNGAVSTGGLWAANPTVALRRSVLDAIRDDATRLRGRVGLSDQRRLDAHFTAIRELETRLARLDAPPVTTDICAVPDEPARDYPDLNGRPQIREKNLVMSKILALALACDQTRVFSNFLTYPISDVLFPNARLGHHQMTHDEPAPQTGVVDIQRFIMSCFGDMLQAFEDIEEGDGTLLDHLAVLATSDNGESRTHSFDEWPVLIAGPAGGRLLNDVHVRRTQSDSTSHAVLSLLRAVGVQRAEWGEDDNRVEDGVSEIEVV